MRKDGKEWEALGTNPKDTVCREIPAPSLIHRQLGLPWTPADSPKGARKADGAASGTKNTKRDT